MPSSRILLVVLVALLAIGLPASASDSTPVSDGTFIDDDRNAFEADIEWLASRGITNGCNPPDNNRFCPTEPVTRGQMAAFLTRALNLPPSDTDRFSDDDGSTFEDAINQLADAGITNGCNPPVNDRFCPGERVTRGQMAAFLRRGYADVLAAGSPVEFVDDGSSIFEGDIEWLAATGVTRGCNPPAGDRFCPNEPVTRGQMAAFLRRAGSTTTTTRPAVHSPRPPDVVLLEPAQIPTVAGQISGSPSTGVEIHVDSGAAVDGDGTAENPYASIADAIEVAGPGDTVRVASGTYREYLTTVRSGLAAAPIRIVGDGMPHIQGADLSGRLVAIGHSFITLQGFELSGSDKLIWVEGATGTRILDNHLHDAGGECIRLKYFSSDSEIAHNRIENCGVEGFDLSENSKNGEGIYIGTAPEQLDRNLSNEPDQSSRNWVHHNVIDSSAECIEFKEGASENVADSNRCSGQRDPKGAALGSRGSGNVFYANEVDGAVGAGVRVGGDDEDQGVGNVIVANVLRNTEGLAIAVRRVPQALICGNQVSNNGGGAINIDDLDPTKPCEWPLRTPWS